MPSFNINCPVPLNQQPLNEYLELRKTLLFSWFNCKLVYYMYAVFEIFLCFFITCGFVLCYILIHFTNFYKLLIIDFIVVDTICFLLFFRLYLVWSYVFKRLTSATIFYEESGWYDGQIWIKTIDTLTRDRLIASSQILPFLKRIKYTCFIFCINFCFHYFLYNFF
uniref:Ycf36 n=1 Tax=Caloglossa intermedia TaxID=100879 RepID=A0A1Z1M6I4_9FLOR|nr:hypothetical protein [Caloglossa intermedia]ARW61473.1 hypothetical protein [Caloglossa intermedia]